MTKTFTQLETSNDYYKVFICILSSQVNLDCSCKKIAKYFTKLVAMSSFVEDCINSLGNYQHKKVNSKTLNMDDKLWQVLSHT